MSNEKEVKKVDFSDLPDYKLAHNFRFGEFIRSDMARRLHICNFPSEDILDSVSNNLRSLVTYILQPIRESFGAAVYVNSGFRCKELNHHVNGAPNSFHLYGRAADITASDFNRLQEVVADMVSSGKIKPTEIIFHNTYIHIAL
ncbi:peptidase [Dipodfec virus UOA04_Rod_504]|nr:peptidase [Dipodfec virus UOA04_Rod_504]